MGGMKNEKFYDDLTAEMQSRNEKYFNMGDFNDHDGSSTYGYDGVHGGFECGEHNRNGEKVLQFADNLTW